MSSLQHFRSVCLITLAAMLLLFPCLPPPGVLADDSAAEALEPGGKRYTAYYFHNDYRCKYCLRIEKWSGEIIRQAFAQELESGKITWKLINTDLPENRHYEKDYRLYTKSLIISEITDGKETRWENLAKVWHYLNNEKKFKNYVQTELNAFMGK